MGQLTGQQQQQHQQGLRINVNSVDKLCLPSSNQCNNQADLLSRDLPNSTTGQPKIRSKWRPEIPEINWQDCFCICFFFYLLCSDTESEKRRKAEKKAEKEIVKRRKKILLEQEREKKRRIKEMVKDRERDDGVVRGEKKVKSKRKNSTKEKEKGVVSVVIKGDDHSRRVPGVIPGKEQETIIGIRNSVNNQQTNRNENVDMRIEKRPVNQLPTNQLELNNINNLDSTINQTSTNTVIVSWNDLN